MNANMLSLLGLTTRFHSAFGLLKLIVAFVFALLIVEFTGAISQRSIHSLSGRFISKWIRIVYILPPPQPPDKITTLILQHLMIKLIVYRFASFANVNCHQLIVELFAKPASFRMIVESEFSLKYQINSKLPSLQAFEMTPTDPSKTTTAIATIALIVQPKDSATSTMTFEPNAPSVTPTVDQSIFNGKIILEFLVLFASAKPVMFINILRESKQRNISSAKQFHGRQSRGRSNLATSIFQLTSDIPSQVCEGESYYQAPSGLREEEEMELEHCMNGNELNHNNHCKSRTREEPAIQSTLIHYSAQGRSHLVAAPATQTYWLPRETAIPPAKAASLAYTFVSEGESVSHTFASEGDTSAQHRRHCADSTTTTHLLQCIQQKFIRIQEHNVKSAAATLLQAHLSSANKGAANNPAVSPRASCSASEKIMCSSCHRRHRWSTVVTTVTATTTHKSELIFSSSALLRANSRIFVPVYCTKMPKAISASFLDIVSF